MSGSPFSHLRIERRGPVHRIALARSDVRNAFNDVLIAELTRVFEDASGDPDVRVVVLSGDGPAFCAGADVASMGKAGGYSREENEADAQRMALMLRAIDVCPHPVIALAHGAAIGGGVGLVGGGSDIAIAAEGQGQRPPDRVGPDRRPPRLLGTGHRRARQRRQRHADHRGAARH